MPRTMDPRLAMVLERANPQVCDIVEIHEPDTGLVLRSATDQFLGAPLVSQTPASSLGPDAGGAITLASTGATLASLMTAGTATTVFEPAQSDYYKPLLGWELDPAFTSAVLRSFSAKIKRFGNHKGVKLLLQIYRVQGIAGHTSQGAQAIAWNFVALLGSPATVAYDDIPAGAWSGDVATVTWDLRPFRFAVNETHVPPPTPERTGEKPVYYFEISLSDTQQNFFAWVDSASGSAPVTVAGVGNFRARTWRRDNRATSDATKWAETLENYAGCFTVEVESYAATSQAVYAIALPKVPNPESTGAVVFDRGTPVGTSATAEISTAGSGGPWTAVGDGSVIAAHQQTYHMRLTLTADAAHRLAPRVSALGVGFTVPVDVTAEAIVESVAQEIGVPFLAAAIGEGQATVVRTGRRDYRDPASDVASSSPVSKLEVESFLGSRHPLVPRDAWMRIDRALVNDRRPIATSEQFNLLSYLKLAKRQIPDRTESVNAVHTVTSATTGAITVTPAFDPPPGTDAYKDQGYYIRVRKSSQVGVSTGFVATVTNNSGTSTLQFLDDLGAGTLPGVLIAGDEIELHSARFVQVALTWVDADPADIWLEILTDHLAIPVERIGRGDLGTSGRGGLPPHVTDRAPGTDAAALDLQKKLLVTLKLTEAEDAGDLLDQLSFIMGGATVEIGGQIVFRQIYPSRDLNGHITVPLEPIAETFDIRNIAGLDTPVGLEQRVTQLACDYGVDTTAVGDAPPALTQVTVDGDALAWLDSQSVDKLASAAIDAKIARWCYNSADQGITLASLLTQQVVFAASTGLRVWQWQSVERKPKLVVGDRVAVITDAYTDYDPATGREIRGWYSYHLVLISVHGGGKQFRGFMLGLSDAVKAQGGDGTLAADDTETASEILSVTPTESADGLTRQFDVVAGAAVATIHVHHRIWPVGTQGDPFDFSEARDLSDNPELTIVRPDPADGHFRFALGHPQRGFYRYVLMVPRRGPPSLAVGANVWKDVIEPAPSALNAKIHATVTNGTADLSIEVKGGPSDWPVRVLVHEGSTDATPLVDTVLTAQATLDKISFPVLGGRALPLRELEYWWVQLINVAGEDPWFGPESANRDPLPQGVVTVDQYRAAPTFKLVFDTDTDAIRITTPDGRHKTFTDATHTGALATSPVFYTVGDALDDASTETALGIDETRNGYLVEFQGGGTWLTVWGPAALHGKSSVTPTVKTRATVAGSGDAEDLFITPDSGVPELLRVLYRNGDTSGAPEYGLVVSAGDSTPLYVTAGTEIGPSNFFQNLDLTGSPSAKLSAIPLTHDQVKRVQVGVEGQQSLVRAWYAATLSLLPMPLLESVEASFDPATRVLSAIVRAGARTQSVGVEFADNSAFSAPITAAGNVSDGNATIIPTTLSLAQLGKKWYVRVTPYSAVSLGGLPGVPQNASDDVPAIISIVPTASETANVVTITLVVTDGGGYLDPAWTNGSITGPISWEIVALGIKTTSLSTTHPGSGTSGTYTKAVTLDPKHAIVINAYAHLLDGSTEIIGSWTADSDKVSDPVNAAAANNGATATVTVKWDTDTASTSTGARWSSNGGSTWTTVSSLGLQSQFSVNRTSVKQTIIVQGVNAADGLFGHQTTVEVDAFETTTNPVQLEMSVDANGAVGFTVDLPQGTNSFKWLISTSSTPTDASVLASGTLENHGAITNWTVNGAATLTFGQTAFLSLIPFTGASATGTQLPTIHGRGAYLTYSASKTQNYGAPAWQERVSVFGINWDASHNAMIPAIAGPGYAMVLDLFAVVPQGVTISQVGVNALWATAGNKPTAFTITVYRRTGSGLTSIGTATPSATAGWVLPTISLSESVSAGRSYVISVSWSAIGGSADAGSAGVGDVSVTYTMPDPKQTL